MLKAFRSMFFVVLLSANSSPAYGQLNFSVGGELARPISNFAELIEEPENSYGVNIAVTYWLNYQYQLISSVGYVTYGNKALGSRTELQELLGHDLSNITERIEGDFSGIPLTIGLRYFLMKRLFIQGSAGVVYKKWRQEQTLGSMGGFVKERDLIASQGIGLLIGRFNLVGQCNLAQNNWRWFSLRVSMIFGKL